MSAPSPPSGPSNNKPPLFVPPSEDHCPYSPEELAEAFAETDDGEPLSELWRKLRLSHPEAFPIIESER